MRTAISRRGGPAGRCQPWLKLSKHHLALRKLIPLYFPSNRCSPKTENSLNVGGTTVNSVTESKPLYNENEEKKEGDTVSENASPCAITMDSKDSGVRRHRDICWNVDFDATAKLHGSINTALIYESLNLSPIHWKCVPQIHGLPVKHCAALSGVIIQKKRRKLKRLHHPSVASTENAPKQESTAEAVITEVNDKMLKSPTDATAKDQTLEDENPPVLDEGLNVSNSVELPKEITIQEESEDKSQLQGDVHSPQHVPNLASNGEKSTETSQRMESARRTCRLCQISLRRGDQCCIRFCSACFQLLREFARDYTKLDDLACLRDTPCPTQWPAQPFNPDAPHPVRSTFRLLEEKYGYVAPEWCVPCKVVHSIRLGFRFSTLRNISATAAHELTNIDLDALEDPILRHRGRVRRAERYLSLLKRDYSQGPLVINDQCISPQEVRDDFQSSISPLSRLFDAFWVRPLHLPSRGQFNEAIKPSQDTAWKCTPILKPTQSDVISLSSHNPETSTSIQEAVISTTFVPDEACSDVTHPIDQGTTPEIEQVCETKEHLTELNTGNVVNPSDFGVFPLLRVSSRLCSSTGLLPIPGDSGDTVQQLSSPSKATQTKCYFCRIRCSYAAEQSTCVIQAGIENYTYAITIGPARIGSRPRKVNVVSTDVDTRNSSPTLANSDSFDASGPLKSSISQVGAKQNDKIEEEEQHQIFGQSTADEFMPTSTADRNPTDRVSSVKTFGARLLSITDKLLAPEACDTGPVIYTKQEDFDGVLRPLTTFNSENVQNEADKEKESEFGSLLPMKNSESSVVEQAMVTDPLTQTLESSTIVTTMATPFEQSATGTEHSPTVDSCEQSIERAELNRIDPTLIAGYQSSAFENQINHTESFGARELEICATCLCEFRRALRGLLERYHEETLDCVTKLMQNPKQFCASNDTTSASDEKTRCSRCDICFLYDCLSEVCALLQPTSDASVQRAVDHSLLTNDEPNQRNKSSVELILPVGGPLILAGPRLFHSSGETLYDRRLSSRPISDNDGLSTTTISHSCVCCMSPIDQFLDQYSVNREGSQLVCSGCLWTWLAEVHSAYHDPGVKRIAKRLSSAATATDACLPLLSPGSRRTLVDTARLARLLSIPCTGVCIKPCAKRSPLWLECSGCTTRRMHRLLSTRLPLCCPRWYRRRLQLICKSRSVEDLDPRVVCSQTTADIGVSHRLALVDVEYTNAVIERWLLPPEPPITAELGVCSRPDDGSSESESLDSTDDGSGLSDTSIGISSTASPLILESHESDYGAESWWENETTDETTKMEEDHEPTPSISTEAEVGVSSVEESVTSKRRRKLTSKAAETMETFWRRSRSAASGRSKQTLESRTAEPERAEASDPVKQEHLTELVDAHSNLDSEQASSAQIECGDDLPTEVCDSASVQSTHDTSSPITSPKPGTERQKSIKNHGVKRKMSPLTEPIVKSKRSLKINSRFLDDYTGNFFSLVGEGRQIRESSPADDEGDDSESDGDAVEPNARRFSERRGSKQNRPAGSSGVGRPPGTTLRGRTGRQSTIDDEVSEQLFSLQKPTGLGPRVKQVSRHALKPDPDRYGATISAMVHAARLAAVGAKIPGGTSPNHAALAATSRAASGSNPGGDNSELIYEDSDGHELEDDADALSSRWSVSKLSQAPKLPLRCGQCPACIGLIQACGRCSNCRLLQERGTRSQEDSQTTKIGPCKQLVCFRRRPERMPRKSGPRVKLPTSFAQSGPSGSSHSISVNSGATSNGGKSSTSPSFVAGPTGHVRHYRVPHRLGSPRSGQDDVSGRTSSPPVNLLETVPGLAQQLDADAWLARPDRGDNQASLRGRYTVHRRAKRNPLNVYSYRSLTPINGGDLGMHFNSSSLKDDSDTDKDRIRPVEGEVVTSELAHHGGYAIVTTMASAPPKEICYACGSGGGQLLFCVSCAEPYHFYCVERQFRPRRKDHFICRNCTQCGQCRKPAADLRCVRCSTGYHPSCLPDYPPAQSVQRGNWICPHCATCIHCGTTPLRSMDSGSSHRGLYGAAQSTSTGDESGSSPRFSVIPWSSDVNKCAACSLAEARGDVCPECDRAYLPTSKQMIQCDSCQLWMHRTCTKLTVDEYEWIARLPPGRLNKFVVYCSVCQNEKGQQQIEAPHVAQFSREGDHQITESSGPLRVNVTPPHMNELDPGTDGANRLRSIARDTLMERMAGLVANCRQSTGSSGSPSPSIPPGVMRSNGGIVSIPSAHGVLTPNDQRPMSPQLDGRYSLGDSDSSTGRKIPQLDGAGDMDSGGDGPTSRKRTPPNQVKLFKPRVRGFCSDPLISRASDALLDEHDGSSAYTNSTESTTLNRLVHSNGGTHGDEGNTPKSLWNAGTNGRDSHEMYRLSNRLKSHRVEHRDEDRPFISPSLRFNMFLEDDKLSLRPSNLPTNIAWLVEDESEYIWTSPRSLIYRLLTRILHKLSAHPTNSPHATTLRRLLRWLNTITESSFPWLNLGEMASDVRDVLRQTNGEFAPVLKHFERLALIELHELVCPVVARLSETKLHGRLPVSGLRATNCLSSVKSLHATILQHIKSHHSHVLVPRMALPSDIPAERSALAEAKRLTACIKPSQCNRPHELEVIDRLRNETREERWVEHWSTIEEEMVLQYFQRHLVRLARQLSAHGGKQINGPISPQKSNAMETAGSLSNLEQVASDRFAPCPPPESVPATISTIDPLDEAFQDVDSVLAADDLSTIPSATSIVRPQSIGKISPDDVVDLTNEVTSTTSRPLSPMHMPIEPFYFARDDFWAAATVSKTGEEQSGCFTFDFDADSADEDGRCCLLCGHHGDSNIEGRLLFTGADTWVHVNCALWSNEVYEEETGQLIGLADALRRARTSVCGDCGRFGATMICSNASDPSCSLHSTGDLSDARYITPGTNCQTHKAHAVHFACALRRRPPAPRPIFTADRSWFCSPECHRSTGRQRLAEGIREMRRVQHSQKRRGSTASRSRYTRFESPVDHEDEEDFDKYSNNLINDASSDPLLDKEELLQLENTVADDLEPISLGELLVCRRVFVPSDCFAASLYPASVTRSLTYRPWLAPDDNGRLQMAAQLAVKNLAVSPNSLAFLQCTGLAANNLVVTIGSLRIDRLGEVREASDALAAIKSHLGDASVRRWNYLCPISYRARRIFWSCTKLDARISYTLHVRQTYTTHNPPLNTRVDPTHLKPSHTRLTVMSNYNASDSTKTSPSINSTRIPDSQLRTILNTNVDKTNRASRIDLPIDPHPGFPLAKMAGARDKALVDSFKQIKATGQTNMESNSRDSTMFQKDRMRKPLPISVPVHASSHSSEVIRLPQVPFLNVTSTATTATTTTHPGALSLGQLSCRINVSSDNSANASSEMGSGSSTVKIVKAVSLAPSARFPQSSAMQPGQMQIAYHSSTANPGIHSQAPPSAVNTRPVLIRTSTTVPLSPAQFPRNAIQSSVSMTQLNKPTTTSIVGDSNVFVHTSINSTTSVHLANRASSLIRIHNIPTPRSAALTTPTKDLQLAIQLNGLFQNLPASRSSLPRTSLPVANPCRQLPLGAPNALSVIRTETTPTVTHLLPQLDGTLDLDEDCYQSGSTTRPCRKRGRPSRHHRVRRTSSVTSENSSNSIHSSLSKRHRGQPHRLTYHRSVSSSSSSTQNGRTRGKPPYLFSKPKPTFESSAVPTPRSTLVRRRWIEERNRQQELAHLVSKAKRANQARLYQNEVEKHARAYRLRFAIDGVVRAAANPTVAWQTVLGRVAALRERHGLTPLICSHADGWTQFGLSHRYVVFLVEQMRGAFHCYRYRFRYHRRKIERLRQKFTPPVPLTEGCARALMWTKPRLPTHHARDPLSFLSCTANPPPRPLFKPSQMVTSSTLAAGSKSTSNEADTKNPAMLLLSPGEPATMLSPNEQIICAEAARQAASLVASQLRLPMRVREACIARAVVQATGLAINSSGSVSFGEVSGNDLDDGVNDSSVCDPKMDKTSFSMEDDREDIRGQDVSSMDEETDDDTDEDVDLGTVSTQFRNLISGPMARLLHVTVRPSRIHGRGLFALRGFREDEMVIEYLGEQIRNLVCETREIRYRAAGVDCYMFRIDADWVIDATYAGNAARFINHSCEPNCYAKVISVDDQKHIVILAQRKIYPGEELTYDYRFPKESEKLLCNCGSYMCRRYLN